MDFGVVVGIEHYPEFRSLQGAAGDARRFRAWLCDRGGGGLKRKNTKLILSNPQKRTPVQDEIDRVLVEVLESARAQGGARRLYFYFSGHGATNPRQSGADVALLLTRWSSSLVRLALSTEGYSSTLCGVGLFEEVAIFIDCCRSVSEEAVGLPPTFTRLWEASCRTRSFIAFATESGQPAFECQTCHAWEGLFTRCLLSILRGAPDGVSASLLQDRLEREVEQEALRRGLCQRAYANNGLSRYSRFGSRGRPPLLKMRLAGRRGQVVLRDGDLLLVARHEADRDLWTLRLPVGLYWIEGGGRDPVAVDHDGREDPHDL